MLTVYTGKLIGKKEKNQWKQSGSLQANLNNCLTWVPFGFKSPKFLSPYFICTNMIYSTS